MPVDGADSALSMMLGLVCENCDTFNDPGVSVCTTCASPLGESTPDEPLVTPVSGTPRPISGVGAAADGGDALAAIGDGIELDPITEPPPAPPPMPAPPSTAASAAAPPPWMSAPTGQPLATQFAMPKVDLASVAREGQGLTAPKPAEAPVVQMRPTATPLATPMAMPPPAATATATATPAATPAAAAAAFKAACWRCGVHVEKDDKFCRNCGARADGANVAPAQASSSSPSPLATTQIAALKMPSPLPSPVMPAGATMVMPAMRAAQHPMGAAGGGGGGGGAGATLMFSAQTAERHAKLILVRGQNQHGSQWRLSASETWLGRAPPTGPHDAVMFPDDAAMARAHCRLVFHGTELWLEPQDTLNGVFLRVREPMRLAAGDEMVVGAQRLRVMAETDRPSMIAPDETAHTRTLGSLVRQAPPIMLMRVASEPALNEVFHRCQRLLTIGRNNCDLNFPRDSFVSERHAQLTHEGSALVLEDLRSRNGTYVRARYATKLAHGDLVLLGDKVLRVELPR